MKKEKGKENKKNNKKTRENKKNEKKAKNRKKGLFDSEDYNGVIQRPAVSLGAQGGKNSEKGQTKISKKCHNVNTTSLKNRILSYFPVYFYFPFIKFPNRILSSIFS